MLLRALEEWGREITALVAAAAAAVAPTLGSSIKSPEIKQN